ncbi:MAG: NTPase [Candidatus Thermoplasmatota archaeon]|nr:NTPase [Candidatus Thermoplasmatota archaeon]
MVKSLKIGISGPSGMQKSETIKSIIDMLKDEDISVGGMITEPIMEDNRRVGFQVMDWQTKEKAVFSHLDLDSQIEIKGYGVNLDSLDEVGVKAIKDAANKRDVVLIDEIGKMQVESEKFADTVRKILELNKPLIITFEKKSRNTLLQDLRRRDDVRMLELTDVNKELLPYKVVELIKEELKGD